MAGRSKKAQKQAMENALGGLRGYVHLIRIAHTESMVRIRLGAAERCFFTVEAHSVAAGKPLPSKAEKWLRQASENAVRRLVELSEEREAIESGRLDQGELAEWLCQNGAELHRLVVNRLRKMQRIDGWPY